MSRLERASVLRIAVVADRFFGHGGAEILARQWAIRTIAAGHEVSVFCGDADLSACDARNGIGARVFSVGSSRLSKISRMLGEARKTATIGNRLKEHGLFDVVHSHRLLPIADVITLGFPLRWVEKVMPGEKKKTVHHLHKAMESEAVGTAKALIVTSPLAHELWIEHYPEHQGKFVLIRPGVDTSAMASTDRDRARADLARRFGMDPSLPLLLFVGNDWKRKRLPECLDAIAMLPFRANLIVAGHGGKDQALRKRENDRIRFVGTILSGIESFYAGSDCLIFPSKLENFGMVVTEALSVGTPVITSTRTGAKEAVEETGMGHVLAEPIAPRDVAVAIAQMFPKGRPASCRSCWSPLDQKFDWKTSVDRLLSTYASSRKR
ncbi:MAG: glycosyltransferase family 4 protein [Methylacidiphilaceae bacterium]|nr:glycosyltransferase family 4 protein [Candidatus Methylacidiphilaceae bacterium]